MAKADLKLNKDQRVAIYPGTFDPITYGHVDLIERALETFDRIIILIGHSRKKHPLLTAKERKQLVEQCFPKNSRISVEIDDGLLATYAAKKGIKAVIRGLRAVSDFEYEFQMATMNQRMNGNLETFFLMASEKYFFINSTLVKEVFFHGGDVSELVPPHVCRKLGEHK